MGEKNVRILEQSYVKSSNSEDISPLSTSLLHLEAEGTTKDSPLNDSAETDLEVDWDDPIVLLNRIRKKNITRPIIAHLNINFLENKFELLIRLIKEKVDTIFLSETKLDPTFPPNQFAIEGFSKAIRLDRNWFGGGILFFIRDNLSFKELESHELPKGVEGIFLELMMGKTKWLIMGGYNPQR